MVNYSIVWEPVSDSFMRLFRWKIGKVLYEGDILAFENFIKQFDRFGNYRLTIYFFFTFRQWIYYIFEVLWRLQLIIHRPGVRKRMHVVKPLSKDQNDRIDSAFFYFFYKPDIYIFDFRSKSRKPQIMWCPFVKGENSSSAIAWLSYLHANSWINQVVRNLYNCRSCN